MADTPSGYAGDLTSNTVSVLEVKLWKVQMAPPPVVGAAQALAGAGHDLAVGQLEGFLHPVPEALLEPARIQPGEGPAQGIVRGNPVGQLQEGAQPLLVELVEEGNGHKAVGAAEDGQDRQDHDVRQGVRFGPVHPGLPEVPGISTQDEGSGLSMRGLSAGCIRNRPLQPCIHPVGTLNLDAIALPFVDSREVSESEVVPRQTSSLRRIKENLVRTGRAAVLLLGILLLSALCILSTVVWDWLLGRIVDKEAPAYQVSKMMTDVLLLGCGVVVALGGVISVVGETRDSAVSSQSRKESDAHDDN